MNHWRKSNTPRSRKLVILAIAFCALVPGCVRRRLMVRSTPPGAMVYVDNQPIGSTPCATDFVYYGTREVRLVKPGYETLTINQPIPAPWYEIPPLDFVSENLVPHKIQDYRTVSFNMTPQVIVPNEQLLNRANQLRQTTQQGAAVPLGPNVLPPGTPPPTLVPPENLAPGVVLPQTPTTLPGAGQPVPPRPPTRY